MDRVVTIYIYREQERRGGHCARYPPQQGGRTVVAHRKLRRPVKNFHTAIANVVQTPSFIGEESKSAK